MEFIRSYFHTPTEREMDSSIYITWAGHRICTAEHRIGPRILDNFKIVVVLRGRGIFIQDNMEYAINPGDMFALFPGIKHFYRADPEDPWEIMWVSFNGKICSEIVASINLTPMTPVVREVSSHTIIGLMKGIIDGLENDNGQYALKATGFLYIFFSELMPFTRKVSVQTIEMIREDSIRKALTFIDVNYYNAIDVETLCKHVNISRSHFSRLFKKETGLSITEYICKVRIQRAKMLLKDTGLSINEISKSVGFEDQFYFSRQFRKQVGVSPFIFRKGY